MKHMDIDGMKAGRPLDALIAETIFNRKCTFIGEDQWLRYAGENRGVPCYSIDIQLAWEIVDALISNGATWSFSQSRDSAKACVHMITGDIWAYGDKMPLAICRAALKTI